MASGHPPGSRAPYKCAVCKRQLLWHCTNCHWVVCVSRSCIATIDPVTYRRVDYAGLTE